MGYWQTYKLRRRRRRALWKAFRKRRELSLVQDHTSRIRGGDVLAFTTLRNEGIRLPYFLEYYRKLGVSHFIIVDNDSDDGGREFLTGQPDVSIWHTSASYKNSNFGVHWLNHLQRRYGHGHWNLVVDVDEFFIYPFCDTRPIRALTDWLDNSGVRSFGAMLLDMYPKGPIDAQPYHAGQNPFEIADWFDSGNYVISTNHDFHNLWIQGGPRARVFFPDAPSHAPSLNKIPLVKWDRNYVYMHSTHMLLPRVLNRVYDANGGENASGLLLHAKFLSTLPQKAAEEVKRREHFAGGREYVAYHDGLNAETEMWCKWSEKYINWRQLEILGLMSKGNWA